MSNDFLSMKRSLEKISKNSFLDEHVRASLGLDEKLDPVYKFGWTSVGTTEQAVTTMSSASIDLPQHALTVAKACRVKAGGNVADDAAGTGARTVKIYGLDGNFNRVDETVTLAGASASAATTTTFIRVFRASVMTSGSGFTNAANIVIENTDAVEMIIIPAGLSQTQHMCYCAPAGHTVIIKDFRVFVDSTKTVDVNMWSRNQAGVRYCIAKFVGVSNVTLIDHKISPTIPEKTDLWVTAVVSSGSADVSANGEMILHIN